MKLLSRLRALWQKLFPVPLPAKASVPAPRPVGSSIEPLEGRVAPASLLNTSTVVFSDADGDRVTVKFSKAFLTTARANAIFDFSAGTVDGSTTLNQQLQAIDLTKLGADLGLALGTSITITADRLTSGTGLTEVGAIFATNLSLGKVTIDGDLGQIDAGGNNHVVGVAGLTVQSLGKNGTTTQDPAAVPAASLESTIVGALGGLTVKEDVTNARLRVVNGELVFVNNQLQVIALGKIGNVTIDGSLRGRAAVEAASNNTGLVESAGDIGVIRIGKDLGDAIVGGGGVNSGRIFAGGKIASLTVAGQIAGGAGAQSGSVFAFGSMGGVKLGAALAGSTGADSGVISAGGTMGAVTLGGDILAGPGSSSGVLASGGAMGAVRVFGDIDAGVGAGANSGGISSGGTLARLTLEGSVRGGDQAHSGFIQALDLGPVVIKGGIGGGGGVNSGTIIASGKLASLTLDGFLTGGSGTNSGSIFSGADPLRIADVGAVKIGGGIEGSLGDGSGVLSSGGKIASVSLGSRLLPFTDALAGGIGDGSGLISSAGAMGAVKIFGNVRGGSGERSGAVEAHDRITPTAESAGHLGALTITGNLLGGLGADSGQVRADGKLASATLRALTGAEGGGSGSIQTGLGRVSAGDTGAVKITGAFTGGDGPDAGTVIIGGKLASASLGGLVEGGSIRALDSIGALSFTAKSTDPLITELLDFTVSARGQAVQSARADLAIGRITINGDVANTQFLAGFNLEGMAVNPDAQIGAVVAKGNWTASDLVAGVIDLGEPGFGTAGDAKAPGADNANIVSRIASVVITGQVEGTGVSGDHYGFTAQQVGAFQHNGIVVPLNANIPGETPPPLGGDGDVSIREVALA